MLSESIESGFQADVSYIQRPHSNSFAQNWMASIQEIDSEWVVFLHDDDLLLPEYVQVISTHLNNAQSDVVAIAPNAEIITESGLSLGVYRKRGRFQRVQTQTAVLRAYFFSLTSRPPPFPSYCYRSNLLKSCSFMDAGRMADVIFLMNLSQFGALEWLPNVLFQYRVQADQDTRSINLSDLSKFVDIVGQAWPRVYRAAFFIWLMIRLFRARILWLLRFRARSK